MDLTGSSSNISPTPPSPPEWEIAKLVRAVTGPTRAGRRRLLTSLGYASNGKAAKRLDAVLTSGSVTTDMHRRLLRALPIEPAIVDLALVRTSREIAAYEALVRTWAEHRERCAFRPHIVVEIDIARRRLPIFAIAITGAAALLRIDLPADVMIHPIEAQIDDVRAAIDEYMAGPFGSKLRICFNEPTGYTYCPAYDESWDLTHEGELILRRNETTRIGDTSIRIRKRQQGETAPSGSNPA